MRIIAELLNKPYSTLMAELSRQEGHKLGADMLLPIMSATESTAPLEFMAREMGGVFVPYPEPAETSIELVASIAQTVRQCGEMFTVAASHFADGWITQKEMEEIDLKCSETIVAILSMKKLAQATFEEQRRQARRIKG